MWLMHARLRATTNKYICIYAYILFFSDNFSFRIRLRSSFLKLQQIEQKLYAA